MSLIQRPQSQVTINGLTLASDREAVFQQLGAPTFQTGSPRPTRLEYWYHRSAHLQLDFDQAGRLLQAQGGSPEIDGENVRDWSLEQVEAALGPASGASRGQSLTEQASAPRGNVLRYPARHLLVRQNQDSSIEFLLFTGEAVRRI